MKKYYYIKPENKVEGFTIQCDSKMADGRTCYLAISCTTGEEVWLYPDAIEYIRHKPKHKIVSAYEVKEPPQGVSPYQYMWGYQTRDKRRYSICRPYQFK